MSWARIMAPLSGGAGDAESVAAAPSTFTLQADAAPLQVIAVTPVQYGANANATLTLSLIHI